jgi:hypothetical protein
MSKSPQQGKHAIPTSNYVTYYDPAKAHHRAWLQAVLDRLVQHEPQALQEGSALRDLWKAAVETKAPQAWRKPGHTTGRRSGPAPGQRVRGLPAHRLPRSRDRR